MDKHRELREVAKDLGYNPESVIFLRNGLPVPDDEIPKEGEEIILMKAFSGG
jgi:ThiS family.